MTTRIQFDFPAMGYRDFHRKPGGGLAAWIRAAADRWRQRRALAEIDDRMLRDMGISRSQAMAEAAKPFWRP
jgi:uncharacterized protein YjiS (DUF1127 family)